MKTKICSICGKEFEGWGNNARPFERGSCCDECNEEVVLKIRLFENNIVYDKYSALVIKPGKNIKKCLEYVSVKDVKDMQKYVGGYIEQYPRPEFTNFVFLVDEEGLLKRLPRNELAQELYGVRAVGNVLVISKNNWK